jgi:hypothetical protein
MDAFNLFFRSDQLLLKEGNFLLFLFFFLTGNEAVEG